MIKCKSQYAYGDKCVICMNAEENPGGVFCCDIAENFGFSGDYILRFCKNAEYMEEENERKDMAKIIE